MVKTIQVQHLRRLVITIGLNNSTHIQRPLVEVTD